MTRFVKVSLSVVALLLVTLMMFTGCANKALTAAEEAAQAVEDAVKELEAAIDEKADADELAAKVDALNAAVEAANALVTDGDTALKAALEEAKKTVFANAEALISTYNTQITALLNAKANVADVNVKFDQLKVLEQNLNNITGGAIKIEEYTSFSTTAAYYAYKLEMLWNDIEDYEELYTEEDFASLVQAYKYCEVAIYRATSESVLKQAFDNFEAAMKDAKNAVDVLYYDDILPYVNGSTKNTEAAYNLYNKVKTTYDGLTNEKAKKLVREYYSGYLTVNPGKDYTTENLLVKTIELWRAELKADVDELGTRYLVYVANSTYTDKADIDAARSYIDLFNGTTAGEGQPLTQGEAAKVGVDAFVVPGLFTANETRMAALTGKAFLASGANGAAAAAEYVNAQALAFFFGNDTDKTLADVDDALIAEKAVATRESVNAINYLKKIVDQWASDFAPALGSNPSTANQTRYAANKAAMDEVTAVVNATYSYLYDGAIAEYKAEAAEFIAVAEKFFENGEFDQNLVLFTDGPAIEAALVKANAWATKWIYTDLDVYDATVDVTAVKAYGALLIAKEYYPIASQTAINAWKALASNIALYATWTEDTLVDMYDNTLETTLAWYTTYGFATNGVVDETVNTIIIPEYVNGEQMPTTEYFAELNRLIGVRDAAYAAQTAAKNALQAKIDAIDTLTLAAYGTDAAAITALKAEIADYKAITANGFVYASAATAHTLDEADVAAAETRYDNLVEDVEELADAAEDVMALTSATGRDNVISAKNDLSAEITAFVRYNGEDDANYTRAAYAAVKFAEKLVEDIDIKAAAADLAAKVAALENAVTALENANDDITVAPYFADDIAKNAHVALMDAIATAKANLNTSANAYAEAVNEYVTAYTAYQAYDANLLDVVVDALPGAVDYNTNKAAAEADAAAAIAEAEIYVAKYNIVVTKLDPIKAAAQADTHGDAELAEVVTSQYIEALAKVDTLADVTDTVAIYNIVHVYEQAITAAWALAGYATPII